MPEDLAPLLWVALVLPLLVVAQRWIHRHVHGVSLLLTGNPNWALILYAIVLFPGVLLHELSHWLTAGMLGVRTGKLSVIPRPQEDGSIQLGYVEYYRSRSLDPFRESLIGGAPLIFGTTAILLIAFFVFDVSSLTAAMASTPSIADTAEIIAALRALLTTSDVLLWLYLLFAISNGMLPSPSDRRAWPAFVLISLVLVVVTLALGRDRIAWEALLAPASVVFSYLGVAFSLALGVDLLFILLIAPVEALLSRIKRVELVYGDQANAVSKHTR
jgi:hypothetical protein